MSIASLHSNPWSNHWAASTAPQSSANAPSGAAPTGLFFEVGQVQASFGGSGSNAQNAARTSDAGTASGNPLQALASDIQAMLIQAQAAAGQSGSTGGTTSAATPEQAVASDLQSLIGDVQAATAPNAQTANADPTGPTGAAGHHHHHHHGGGGEANGTFQVAATSTSGTQSASGRSEATNLAANIAQATLAYAVGGPAAAISTLMA